MKKYILGIDQSTQGTKALIFDGEGRIVCRADRAHRQIVNEQGWVEHDPLEIMQNVCEASREAIERAGVGEGELAAIGLSNQRETVMAWDKATGKPIYNAIVWQCARGEKICARLEAAGWGEKVKKATGLNLSPYFSAAKLAWLMENVPEAKELAEAGRLLCGTMDSFIVYSLTGGKVFKTDYSNASRTELFNIRRLAWDEELCAAFGVPRSSLPEVEFSDGFFGETDLNGLLKENIPIHAVLGDSHAALFGQGCTRPGSIKATYGTGSSIMMNTGKTPIESEKGLVTSLAWGLRGEVSYVLEGNINYTGAVISWLKDDLKLIGSAKETEALARGANASDKSYLVPAFTGLGAPYWESGARAMLMGMSRVTGKAEVVRAALESIAYQVADVALLMQEESGYPIEALCADGGPTKNRYLMEFQSDILDKTVKVPKAPELSACGAAYAAGLALGLYDGAALIGQEREIFSPRMAEEEREWRLSGWHRAVAQAISCQSI